jgi:D-alanyl-D-alanine dipeptidase/CubicO group peptidase (beta-lactamase class C family)
MRWAALLLVVAAGACREGRGANGGARGEYQAIAGALEPFVRHEMADKELPAVSIALVDGADIAWAAGFGYANPADSIPATAETIYRAGPITPLVTAIAVMQLVERGDVDLDAPVTRYLPEFRPRNSFKTPITVRQLLGHRSGLLREPPVGSVFDTSRVSLGDVTESLARTDLIFEPGTRTKYSDAGLAVAGHLVERLSKQRFSDAAKAMVFDHAGLTRTTFAPAPASAKDVATGLLWSYDGRTSRAPVFAIGATPATGLYSTVTDLGRLLGAMIGEGTSGRSLLKHETASRMWQASGTDSTTALGFDVWQADGTRRIGQSGSFEGYSATVVAIPDERLAAVVITSRDAAEAVTSRIADAALKLMRATREAAALPAPSTTVPLKPGVAGRLDGTYVGSARGGVSVAELDDRNGRLLLRAPNAERWLEVKSRGDTLITDDRLGFGQYVAVAGDRLVLGRDTLRRAEVPRPYPAPERWAGLIGEYGPDFNTVYVREDAGRLHALVHSFFDYALVEETPDVYRLPDNGLYLGERIRFRRGSTGKGVTATLGAVSLPRRSIAPEDGSTFKIVPLRPAEDLVREALASTPPKETGDFLAPDFLEVARLDPTIKLDMRYATTNNFVSTAFYKEARAFLQRPAAEALVRANQRLLPRGYGLLIHDSYRPWYVTRMFWDATPEDKRMFVANPANGSRHNRGCAIDLTLYDLKTGRPIQMVSGYDEFSDRAYPDYPGGTSLQRWHRKLLRRAMEAEGFTVFNTEWWHFDYRDWRKYPISNVRFEEIP